MHATFTSLPKKELKKKMSTEFSVINDVFITWCEQEKSRIRQGHLKIWTEDLKPFFISWKPVGIWKNGTNII